MKVLHECRLIYVIDNYVLFMYTFSVYIYLSVLNTYQVYINNC